MAKTYFEYTGDGVRTVYPAEFVLGYLQKGDIHVYQGTDHTIQLEYTWQDSTTIELAAPIATGTTLRVRRVVNRSALQNDYQGGAVLEEDNLNNSFRQGLMVAEEVEDGILSAAGTRFPEGADLVGSTLSNIADGIEPQDAASVAQVATMASQGGGTAAARDTGTLPTQIPLNRDLGSAAILSNSFLVDVGENVTRSTDNAAAIVGLLAEDVTQAARITTNEADIVALLAEDVVQAARLAVVEADNTAQDAAIAAVQSAQVGGLLSFTTYALLDAYTPANTTEEKSSFKVTNDGTASLNGYYHWVSGTVYAKDAEAVNGTVEEGSIDTVSGGEVHEWAGAAINGNAASYHKQFPNLHDDPSGKTNTGKYRWVGSYNPLSVTGRPILRLDASNVTVRINVEDAQAVFPSGFVSAGALWTSKTGAGTARQLLIQYDAGGAEIERNTISRDSLVTITRATWFESVGVVLNPLTVKVSQVFDVISCELDITNFYIANGSVGGMREPYDTEVEAQAEFLGNAAFAAAAPNLVDDPLCIGTAKWITSINTLTTAWVPSINKSVLQATVTGGVGYSYQVIPIADAFEGATTFSWSVRLVRAITSNSGSRVFVRQHNAAGAELSRTTVSSLDTVADNTVLYQSDVALDPLCTELQFYIDGGVGADGTGSEFTDVCLRKGSEHRMGHYVPPVTVETQQNAFTDTALVGGVAYGGVGTRVVEQGVAKLEVTATSAQEGYRWYIPATGAFAPTSPIYVSVLSTVTESNYVSGLHGFSIVALYRDANDTELSRTSTYAQVEGTEEQLVAAGTVPADTSYIEIRAGWWGSVGNLITGSIHNVTITAQDPRTVLPISLPTLTTAQSVGTGIVYVSTTGSDTADGSLATPVKTFNKAAEVVGGSGIVKVLNDGVYPPQTINSANAVDLVVVGDNAEKPHIRGGVRQAGWTLEDGETNVWYRTTPLITPRWLWEGYKDDAETVILDVDRETQHRGKTHRLEHTKLYAKDSLLLLKAGTSGYYHDGTNLYIKPANVYGNIEDAWIMDATSSAITCAALGNIKLQDLIVDFAGINVSNSANAELFNVETIGAGSNGLTANDCRGTLTNSRFAGSSNDGTNFHNSINVDILGVSWVVTNSWCHDSGDDGDSMHEHCVGLYVGGLYEYNQDRGSAPSYGSHTIYHNVKTKYNGYLQTPSGTLKGEGIGMVGSNSETGGYGTSTECHNCVDIGSFYSFANHANTAGELSSMRLYNCRSEKGVVAAYSSVAGAPLYLNDCGESATVGTVKLTNNGGVIVVSNSTLVT